MVQVRSHPGAFDPSQGGYPPASPTSGDPAARFGGRLNLLLSCASWRDDSWADRLPQLLEPMGVHSVRARSAAQAEKVIRSVPVHIAVVDLGLPMNEDPTGNSGGQDEAGPRILELLRRLESPPPTVVVKSIRTQRDDTRYLFAALRCGAFAVVDRRAVDIEQMLEVLRRCLTRFYQNRWPGGGSATGTAGGGTTAPHAPNNPGVPGNTTPTERPRPPHGWGGRGPQT